MRRQARLFAITEYLRGRRTGVTAAALAERFGVTVRTIYRDLDTLRDGSLPLEAERGRGGGYALDRSYALPPVNFTPREAAVLASLGKHAVDMRMLPFPETLERALDKVRGALGASAQRQLLAHMDKLRFVGVPALAPAPAVRRAVERAWFQGGVLSVRYRNSLGELERRRVRLVGATSARWALTRSSATPRATASACTRRPSADVAVVEHELPSPGRCRRADRVGDLGRA